MKLTSVVITPEGTSNPLTLSFRDPTRANKYNVKGIVGLDADEITPLYYPGRLGVDNYDFAIGPRDIVVRIELNPSFGVDESYSDLRDYVYKMVSASRTGKVQLEFVDGLTVVSVISGFIKKLEAPLFNKVPEIQLTIRCDSPMLTAPDVISVDVGSLDFEDFVIIDDISTAPHGFAFEAEVLDTIITLTIGDHPSTPTWRWEVTIFTTFVADDVLYFSSDPNDRYFRMLRGSTMFNLADSIHPRSQWPMIFPGSNAFCIEDAGSNLDVTSLTYYPTYWGV